MFKQPRHSLFVYLSALLALAQLSGAVAAQETKISDRRVAAALELWHKEEPRARLEGLHRLGRLGPRSAPAVVAIIAGLSDRDSKIREETAAVMHAIGPAANAAVRALISALSDSESEVRISAAWALQVTRPDPKIAMPAFLANLHSGPDRRCSVVVYAMAALGEPAVPALIELLRDNDKHVRWMAGYSLSRIGPAARSSIPALVEALPVPHREIREFIAGALAGIGPEAVEPLIRALRDRDPKVRGGAALAIEKLGAHAKAAAPALFAALSDPEPPDDPKPPRGPSFDFWQREGEPQPWGYYAALRGIGPPAVPVLLEKLNAPDSQARIIALRALEFLGDGAKSSVPRLVELLNDKGVRSEAASALGGIGVRDAIPVLITALTDPDPGFRARVAETLGRIGWERQAAQFSSRTFARGAIRPLGAALKDVDPGVRASAARALRDIGSQASVAIPDLVAALSDPSANVRVAVLRAFGRIGRVPAGSQNRVLALLKDLDPRARAAAASAIDDDTIKTDAAVVGLLAVLKDPDADVRAAAAQKLGRGHVEWFSNERGEFHDSPGLVQNLAAPGVLQAALADPDPRVRAAVAWLLPAFKRAAPTTVPLLTARLKDPDVKVRRAAGEALSRFGPAAKEAVPALLEALADPDENFSNDEYVSAKAAKALDAIGPAANAAMIERLTGRLGNSDESVRRRASWALQRLSANVASPLFRLLADRKTARAVKIEIVGVLVDDRGTGVITSAGEKERPGTSPEAHDAIPVLNELARDEDEKVRRLARKLLVAIAPNGESAARSLLEAIRAGDVGPWGYDQALAELKPSATLALIEGLKDSDGEVRTAAAYALAELADDLPGPEDQPEGEKPDPAEAEARAQGLRLRSQAGDALVAALKDSDTEVQWAAAWALSTLGVGERAVPALIHMVNDRTTRVANGARIRLAPVIGGGAGNWNGNSADGQFLRVGAIQALGGFGDAAVPAIPALVNALKDGDGLTRWYAAGVLGELGSKATAAVPGLIALLRSKEQVPGAPGTMGFGGMATKPDGLPVIAAKALGQIGLEARAAVTPLIEVLVSPDPALRTAAVQALGRIGRDAAPAAANLARLLTDPEWSIADYAAEALGHIGAPAVTVLMEALRSRNADVRRRAVSALGGVGPDAAAALPQLISMLADPDEETRAAVTKALGTIGTGPAAVAVVPGLLAALKDPDRLVRKAAAEALATIGARDERTIPALASMMRDRDREVKYAAHDGLSKIGMPAFPALRALFRDDDTNVRDDAARAIARIADSNFSPGERETAEQVHARVKVVRAALFSAFKDPEERIRDGASLALGYIGKDIVPDLVAALTDPSPVMRLHASRALGFVGDEALPSLDPLRERLGDADLEVRRAAEAAIKAIRKAVP
jgi:HEAT repeat protein